MEYINFLFYHFKFHFFVDPNCEKNEILKKLNTSSNLNKLELMKKELKMEKVVLNNSYKEMKQSNIFNKNRDKSKNYSLEEIISNFKNYQMNKNRKVKEENNKIIDKKLEREFSSEKNKDLKLKDDFYHSNPKQDRLNIISSDIEVYFFIIS